MNDTIGSSHRVYGELILTMLKLSIGDIISYSKYCNPENISSILSSTKKYDSGLNNLIKHWHPSEYLGSYNFIFSDEPIFRDDVNTNLKALTEHLPHDSDVEDIRSFVRNYISKSLGYFPAETCSFKMFVTTENKEVNVKKLETNVFDMLVRLTKEGVLEWVKSEDELEKGAAPEFVISRKMQQSGTYLAHHEDDNGVLTCTLTQYTKATEKKSNYSEYVICVQLEANGSSSHLMSKGMGKLWKVVNKETPMDSGNLTIKELSGFLSELCGQ